jgi:hypothetical protein
MSVGDRHSVVVRHVDIIRAEYSYAVPKPRSSSAYGRSDGVGNSGWDLEASRLDYQWPWSMQGIQAERSMLNQW